MVADLIGGQVEMGVVALPAVQGHLKSGALRAIGVMGKTRVASLPDVPTIAEQGFPDVDIAGWFAVVGPAKLPPAEVKRLHDAVVAAFAMPEAREAMAKQENVINPIDARSRRYSSSSSEQERYARLVKKANITHGMMRPSIRTETASMADLFDNPMGLMGFEFVEFASPDARHARAVFEKLGFTLVARHRSKDVVLYRQGDINFIVNREPKSPAATSPPSTARRPAAWRFASRIRTRPTRARSSSARSRSRCRPGRWSCACRRSRASAARRST